MNELKQPLNQEQNKEQNLDQSINSSCCYFDILWRTMLLYLFRILFIKWSIYLKIV